MSVEISSTKAGTGYPKRDGRYADTEAIILLGSQAFGAGQTIGPVFEVGSRGVARLALEVTAKSGTSPTLDVAVETSPDGLTAWRKVGTAFDQKTDVGLAMGAVSESGTTPPDITLTGTPNRYIDLKVVCTKLGNRGTSEIKYSLDGGETYSDAVVTAATVEMVDPVTGDSTGVTLNMEDAAAALNNVWTAKTAGYERKTLAGLDRFVRAVANVGGSDTPTVTASVSGELV